MHLLRAASLFSIRVAADAALLALLCGGKWLAVGRIVTDAPHHNPDPTWPSLLLPPGRRWLGVDHVCFGPPDQCSDSATLMPFSMWPQVARRGRRLFWPPRSVFRFSVADAVPHVAAGGSAWTTSVLAPQIRVPIQRR